MHSKSVQFNMVPARRPRRLADWSRSYTTHFHKTIPLALHDEHWALSHHVISLNTDKEVSAAGMDAEFTLSKHCK